MQEVWNLTMVSLLMHTILRRILSGKTSTCTRFTQNLILSTPLYRRLSLIWLIYLLTVLVLDTSSDAWRSQSPDSDSLLHWGNDAHNISSQTCVGWHRLNNFTCKLRHVKKIKFTTRLTILVAHPNLRGVNPGELNFRPLEQCCTLEKNLWFPCFLLLAHLAEKGKHHNQITNEIIYLMYINLGRFFQSSTLITKFTKSYSLLC